MKELIAGAACAALLLAGPASAAASKAHATAKLADAEGKPLGTVDFAQTNHGVLIEYALRDIAPGVHGIAIHTSGNCNPAKGFYMAGPHFSFTPDKKHGYLTKGGPHAGDLPNEVAAGDGTLRASTITNSFSLGNGKRSIFDRDGASIIVHAKPDDYASQPDGNSGARIACGVIVRTQGPASRKGGARRTHT
jgi:Cu-Zn family superoxide dismutase